MPAHLCSSAGATADHLLRLSDTVQSLSAQLHAVSAQLSAERDARRALDAQVQALQTAWEQWKENAAKAPPRRQVNRSHNL